MPIYRIKAKLVAKDDTRYELKVWFKKREFPNPLLKGELVTFPDYNLPYGKIDFEIREVHHHIERFSKPRGRFSNPSIEDNLTEIHLLRQSTKEELRDLATLILIRNSKDRDKKREYKPWSNLDHAVLTWKERTEDFIGLDIFTQFLQIGGGKYNRSLFTEATSKEEREVLKRSSSALYVREMNYREIQSIVHKVLDAFFNLS